MRNLCRHPLITIAMALVIGFARAASQRVALSLNPAHLRLIKFLQLQLFIHLIRRLSRALYPAQSPIPMATPWPMRE